MKDEILAKLFSSNWNYSGQNKSSHIISLFYKKGGFSKLYDFIVSEKERLNKQHIGFSKYYSTDLIETLQKATIYLFDEDFKEYIFNTPTIFFNKHNFKKLEEYDLLQYVSAFCNSYYGNIEYYHKILGYDIIETFDKKVGKRFYDITLLYSSFDTLEEIVLYKMFNGKYFDVLSTLLDSSRKL